MIILTLTGVFEIHVYFKIDHELHVQYKAMKLQLSIQRITKFIVFKYFQKTEVYLEPSQTSKMKPLTA